MTAINMNGQHVTGLCRISDEGRAAQGCETLGPAERKLSAGEYLEGPGGGEIVIFS